MSKINVLVVPSDRTGVGKFRSVDPHIFLQNLYPQDFLYAFDRAWVWLSVRILNYYLMFEAWKLYRTISE